MVDRVSDQVNQRIANPIENAPVEFDVLAAYLESDFLVLFTCDISDDPRKPIDDRLEWDEPDVHNGLLELRRQPFQIVEFGLDRLEVTVGFDLVTESNATRNQPSTSVISSSI